MTKKTLDSYLFFPIELIGKDYSIHIGWLVKDKGWYKILPLDLTQCIFVFNVSYVRQIKLVNGAVIK